MPKLGESVTEGTITTWLVEVGDIVNKYDPIAEVMTDKVNAEVPPAYSGTIEDLVAKEGDTVSVGDLICYIKVEKEEYDKSSQSLEETSEVIKKTANEQEAKQDQSMRTRFSPAVLR